MKTWLVLIFALILGLIILIELLLRSVFGFGNSLIYIGDEEIGYLLAPNQHTKKMGNRIYINEYSMRSAQITKTSSNSTLRILLVGDSIANGGWWTDQENTISSLIEKSLQPQSKYQKVEVLNASANSWGPRNELAYLQKFGNFQSQIIILLINTDDLFATAPTSLPVGRDRNYPDQQIPLAILEVLQRYLTKQKPIPELEAIQKEGGDRVGINLAAIGKIKNFAQENNSKFLLVMTPLLREIGQPGSRDYEIVARKRLNDFTQEQNIKYIDILPELNAINNPQSLYQDTIHFNLQGNQFVSKIIEQSLIERTGDSEQ
ncbi:MAG: SGNH/GDSL hydrolase family protein [Nostocales cyanobacterium]|nr:MAG: SGNH/GDSL hydrolase family protein [Nostocales cyanobacterium]TAF08657.1 MAG: SGNH/GDSL hydrolase family protein [Nostocales cyanobacterium]